MQEVTKFHILSKEHFSLILWQTKIYFGTYRKNDTMDTRILSPNLKKKKNRCYKKEHEPLNLVESTNKVLP